MSFAACCQAQALQVHNDPARQTRSGALFEMVHDRLLDAAHVSSFKTLILPNIAALSDAQCQQLRDFVKNGGSLIATYETSLHDEWGHPLAGLDSMTWSY